MDGELLSSSPLLCMPPARRRKLLTITICKRGGSSVSGRLYIWGPQRRPFPHSTRERAAYLRLEPLQPQPAHQLAQPLILLVCQLAMWVCTLEPRMHELVCHDCPHLRPRQILLYVNNGCAGGRFRVAGTLDKRAAETVFVRVATMLPGSQLCHLFCIRNAQRRLGAQHVHRLEPVLADTTSDPKIETMMAAGMARSLRTLGRAHTVAVLCHHCLPDSAYGTQTRQPVKSAPSVDIIKEPVNLLLCLHEHKACLACKFVCVHLRDVPRINDAQSSTANAGSNVVLSTVRGIVEFILEPSGCRHHLQIGHALAPCCDILC